MSYDSNIGFQAHVPTVLVVNAPGAIAAPAATDAIAKQLPGELAASAGTFWLAANELVFLRPSEVPATTLVPEDQFFSVAVWDADYGFRQSNKIYKRLIKNLWFRDFVAPIFHQVTVQFAGLLPLPTVGAIYQLTILNQNSDRVRFNARIIQVVSTSTTIAGLLTQFAARINGDPTLNELMVATVAGTNLVLTSIVVGYKFAVALEYSFAGTVTQTVTQTNFQGYGTYDEVYFLEDQYKGRTMSFHDRTIAYSPKPTYYTSKVTAPTTYATGYGILTIEHAAPELSTSQNTEEAAPLITMIAVPQESLAAVVAAAETISGRLAYDYTELYNPTATP